MWTSILIADLLILQITDAIHVGVGISDITGPATETPMVTFIELPTYLFSFSYTSFEKYDVVFSIFSHNFRWAMEKKVKQQKEFILGNIQERLFLNKKELEMSLYRLIVL